MRATLFGAAAVSLLTVSAHSPPISRCRLSRQRRAPPFTWTSCYAGGNVGGGFGQKDLTDTAGILFANHGIYVRQSRHQRLHARWTDRLRLSIRIQLGRRHRRRGIGRQHRRQNHDRRAFGDTATFKETTDFLSSVTGARRIRVGSLDALRQGRRRLGQRPIQRRCFWDVRFRRRWRPGSAGPPAPASNGHFGTIGRSSSNTTITASAPVT